MGEMAEMKMADISYYSEPSLTVDAEPIPSSPFGEGISHNYYSNDLSEDAIAGVPPRSTARAAPAERRASHLSPHSSPLAPRVSPIQNQPVQNPDTEQHVKKSFGSSVQHDDISVRNSRLQQVHSEKDVRNEDDLDSSYGSSLSSMESSSSLSSSWEEELLLYKDKMPTEVREDYYDVMILYTESDYSGAEAFRQHLINEIHPLPFNETCRALLYDSPELTGLSGSKIQQLDLSMERCTYVFVYMTADFVRDKWCEFSSESCLMRAIYDEERRWCVVPIYTERRSECKFKIPMGLNSLKGINFYCNDDFYRRGVSRLIGDKIYYRRQLQQLHKIKQKIWLENYKRELIRVEEQKKRMAVQEENLTLELLRKVGYLPDSDLFPNQHAKMHNSYSESQLSSKGDSLPHSASSESLKPIHPQNPAVAAFLEAYRNNFRHTIQPSFTPTPEQNVLLYSRHLEPDGSQHSPPDPMSEKFQGLHLGSQHSSCSADMGVRSETSRIPDEVELKISPVNFALLKSLRPEQQQKYLDSLLASQQEPQHNENLPGFTGHAPSNIENQPGLLSSLHPQTGPHSNGIPNFGLLSVRSQEPSMTGQKFSHFSHVTQGSDDSSYSSSYSSASVDNSASLEISHPQRTLDQSKGNVPTHLFEDSGSVVFEDSGSMGGQDDDWTLVNHDQVPQVRNNRKGKNKDGKKNRKDGGKDIEMVEKTSKKGQIVHQTIYHIYSPKAVQIGDENIVQDVKMPKTAEDESGPESDTETEVKGQDNQKKEKKTGKESGSDEEDSIGNNKPPTETGTEQIHGEINDVQHNSVWTVAMDAALSSAGSYNPGDTEGTATGQEDHKHNPSVVREEPVLKYKNKNSTSRPTPVTGRVKPALPVKPVLPKKPELDKPTEDLEQTLVKSKVVLPVRSSPNNDDSNQSEASPSIVKKVFQRPMAKIEPCVRNNNEEENTDPKTVIDSEETAVKCPAVSNIVLGDVCAETEHSSLGGGLRFPETAHTNSQQTFRKTSVERPTRSIQSLMPLQALERSGQSENNNNNKEKSRTLQLFQAAPFSISRHSDASTLFYRNRFDTMEPIDTIEDSIDSIDETEAINKLNFSDQSDENGVNQRSLTRQAVPFGEDPLSRTQETLEFIPSDATDLDNDDLEYDFMEDSADEVVSSSESQIGQTLRTNKLSRVLASLRGRPN